MSVLSQYPRISIFLWFDQNAEEAAEFYVGIFPDSRILETTRLPGDGASGQPGKILTMAFDLDGQKMTALNGGPMFKFNEAISLVVRCESQQEIDFYWDKLMPAGGTGNCGWLKDRFGLSWQIIPTGIADLIKSPAAMQAMMTMGKLNIAELEKAGMKS